MLVLKKKVLISLMSVGLISCSAFANDTKPAPPLTSVRVYSVTSTNCGTELIDKNAMATTCDHGGEQLRVAVEEIGYGNNHPVAWLDDNELPDSALYQTDTICQEGGKEVSPCDAGYSVTGWMLYYNLDGKQGGYFEFQDTSMTVEKLNYATLYTHLSIL